MSEHVTDRPRGSRQAPSRGRDPRVRSAPPTEREQRLGAQLRAERERSAVLVDALGCGVELVQQAQERLAEAAIAALLPAIRTAPTAEEREQLAGVAREILATVRENRIALGALERAADRIVLARAALPALRTAALGPSRVAVLEAIGALEAALGGAA